MILSPLLFISSLDSLTMTNHKAVTVEVEYSTGQCRLFVLRSDKGIQRMKKQGLQELLDVLPLPENFTVSSKPFPCHVEKFSGSLEFRYRLVRSFTCVETRVKRPRREADHSPLPSTEVKECVELYLYSPSYTLTASDEIFMEFNSPCVLNAPPISFFLTEWP
jgi:hypothetical protein